MLLPRIPVRVEPANPLKYTACRSGVSLRDGVLSIRTYSGLDGALEFLQVLLSQTPLSVVRSDAEYLV